MDCEKLDAMAIDLVYDELDARATADAEQHLLGCTRCTALVERLRAGKKASESYELVSPSALLESRILEAASRARRPAPWPRRLSRAVSVAGAYAMRPQVAMAAIVLMVGVSVLLLRGGIGARRTSVTDEGVPIATIESTKEEQAPASLARKKSAGESAAAAAPASPTTSPSASSLAQASDEEGKDHLDSLDGKLADKSGELEKKDKPSDGDDVLGGNAWGGKGGADLPSQEKLKSKGVEPGAPPPPMTKSAPVATTTTGTTTTAGPGGSSPTFDDAMTAYTQAKYTQSAKGFDDAFAAGTRPSMSLLYAARSFRALGNCAAALVRFQRLLGDYPSSADAPNAALEGGECARNVGDVTTARTLLQRARTYPSTKARAEMDLAAMDAPTTSKPKPMAPAKKSDTTPSATATAKPPSVDVNDSY